MLAVMGLFGLALAGMALWPDTAPDADGATDDSLGVIDGRTDCATNGTTEMVPLHDFLDGTADADQMTGNDGNDLIRGLNGDDVIRGEDGNDRLFGDAGNDTIEGGRDDDRIAGGAGDDTLNGHVGDDMLRGGAGDDALNGGDGNDLLKGGAGDDTLMGYWGDDRIIGGAGADTLFGGDGNDVLDGRERGTAEGDFLNGGDGDDVIHAGALDMVHGGTGADMLALTREQATSGAATLQDFDAAEDRIVVYFDGAEPPVLDQAETDDGVMLLADGQPLALVQGVRVIDLDAIELIAA